VSIYSNTRDYHRGVRFEKAAIRVELARRMWRVQDLAEASGVPIGSLNAIIYGRPANEKNANRIIAAFENNPPSAVASALIKTA
jgi:hypothetical protein